MLPTTAPVTRLAILGSGAGTTARAVMDATPRPVAAQVCLVISNNSTARILEHAADRGVPTRHLSSRTHPEPADLDAAMAAELAAADVDLVVLAGYMRKLGPRVLADYAGRIVNTHPALLPAYGGVGMYGDRVHAAVLADGTRMTGASVHVVTAEYDEGPVVARLRVPVEPHDDLPSLRTRVQTAEKELLVSWLATYCADPPARLPALSRG